MPAVAPYYMNHPKIVLGDPAGTPVELQCYANNIETNVDQDETVSKTFCGVYTSYGPEKWTIVLTVLQSFGVTGLWTLVSPMRGTVQPFALYADEAIPSVDNPVMAGTALVKAFPFLSGAVNEPSEFDLELAVQGEPSFGITEPVAVAAAPEAAGAAAAAA
jgi:hypothetical protein